MFPINFRPNHDEVVVDCSRIKPLLLYFKSRWTSCIVKCSWYVVFFWQIRLLKLFGICLPIIVMMQMPVQGNRPLVNPTVCVGITAFIVGTAIGIGIGVLISNNRYRGVGGGIWFGRRRRRSLEYQDIDQEDEEQEAFQILENINDGAIKYQ